VRSIASTDNEIAVGPNQVFRHPFERGTTIWSLPVDRVVSVRNLGVQLYHSVNVILISRSAVEFGAFFDDTREEIDSSFWAKTAQNATCQLTLILLRFRLINENTRLILKMKH